MGTWAALGAGGRAIILGLGGVTAVGLGYVALRDDAPAPEPAAEVAKPVEEAAAPAAVVEEPAAVVAEVPEPAPEPEPAPAPEVTVDTWRVAADGSATVAGRAVPDAAVKVLVDGAEVAATKATGSGEYAVLFTLSPNPSPSLMTLVAVAPDGAEMALKAAIALGPIAGPAEVAVAEVAEAPAAVMLTEEGAVVLQDAPVAEAEPVAEAAPEPAAEAGPVADVVIDTIAYTPGGAVQLGGKAQAGAFLRIYLDNAPMQTVLVPEGGVWLTTLKDTAPGIYTLRVDQLDDAGKVTSRFETPFKRESLEALAAVAAGVAEEPAVEVAEGAPVEARVNDVPVAETAPEAEAASVVADGAAVVPDTGEATTRPAQETAPDVPEEAAAPEDAAEEVAEPAAEPVAEAVAVAEPEVEPVAEAVAEPVVEPVSEAVAVAEPEVEPVAEAVAEPAVEPVAEAVAVAEPAVESVAEAVAEPVAEAVTQPEAVAAPSPVTVTVQPGFTLWGIAEGQMGDGVRYVQVFEANKDKIKDPDLIYPGQVFTIPAEE